MTFHARRQCSPLPRFVQSSSPAPRRTEQSSSASASLPETSTRTPVVHLGYPNANAKFTRNDAAAQLGGAERLIDEPLSRPAEQGRVPRPFEH